MPIGVAHHGCDRKQLVHILFSVVVIAIAIVIVAVAVLHTYSTCCCSHSVGLSDHGGGFEFDFDFDSASSSSSSTADESLGITRTTIFITIVALAVKGCCCSLFHNNKCGNDGDDADTTCTRAVNGVVIPAEAAEEKSIT